MADRKCCKCGCNLAPTTEGPCCKKCVALSEYLSDIHPSELRGNSLERRFVCTLLLEKGVINKFNL